jgi:hypothetical protein
MAMQEIYVRNATDTEAKGPYGIEQLVSLAETGGITAETLIYDAAAEQWVTLESNAELMAAVFPEKKKLILKPKEIKTLNKPDQDAKAITVDEMLAAAEGRTDDTADKKDPEIAMLRAARVGMWGAIAILVLSAAGEILPSTDALMSLEPDQIIAHPLVLLGALDVFLAVMLGLGVSAFYPMVRFRAALGFGLLGFMFYAQGLSLPLIELAVGSAGLYLCTIFTSLLLVVIAAAAGVAGLGAVAWGLISTP